MDNITDSKLSINRNVFINKLKDNTKYILLKINDELVPLFFKKEIIDIISFLKREKHTRDELYNHFGSEVKSIISILLNYNIVCEEHSEKQELNFDLAFEEQIGELNYRAFETRTPLVAKMELTYNCNYKCKYCYVDGVKGSMMSFQDIKVIIEKLKDNGVNELFITGGEPFLHPDIMDIIDFAEKKGFITTIQTNASYIDEDNVEKFKEYRNIVFGISFHSANEKKFDEFTQCKGSYKRTLNAANLLKEAKVPFYLKLAVTKENQEDLKSNIKFFKDNGYEFRIYTQIFPNVNDSIDNSKYELDKKYIEWLYKNEYLKFQPTTCTALRTKLWISSKGDLYPCELTRKNLGNLVKDEFDAIWFSKEAEEVLKSNIYVEHEKCKKCDRKQYCNKCLAYLNYDNWGRGLKHFCETAVVVKNIYSQTDK